MGIRYVESIITKQFVMTERLIMLYEDGGIGNFFVMKGRQSFA